MTDAHHMSTDGPRRRTLLGLGAAAGAAALLPAAAAPATAAPGTAPRPGFAAAFASPDRAVRPKFRWWWPDGRVDPAELAREVDQIADAGFGGVEVAAVTHSLAGSSRPIDVERYGWGTAAWVAGLESALRQADRRGLTVDVTIGPAWPAAVPTLTPDDAAAARELAHGLATFQGSYAGPVPPPVVDAAEGVTARRLLWVQAARIREGATVDQVPLPLDRDSVTDLTPPAGDGNVRWTAPDDGRWALISYWERGSGQRPEGPAHTSPLAYVVDHFSAAGTRAVTDFWERHILTRRVRELLRRAGGALFEDSLEIETDATLWTPGLDGEFERRIGHALPPYLAAVVEKDEKYVFTFDAATDKAVRRDYMQVVTDLYLEHHLLPLRAWAHSLGLVLRVQPYGLETDAIHSASLLDIPEGESLGFKNLDDFRCLAGGRDIGGGRVLSNEAGATAGGAYATTWDATLRKLVTQYCAGVNQAVLHGFGYATAPGAAWPGFAAFSPYHGGPGYGEAWGPRTPAWRHVPDVAGYLGRIQGVLQTGTHRVDVAVLRQKGYAGSGLGAPWFTSDGVPLGWTHTFLGPRSLGLPGAVVRDGRLAPDGPAYQVLVLEGDVMIGREHTLEPATARRLIELAEDGLPMIVVGDWSDGHVPGLPHDGDNERLRALITRLLAVPGVRAVADRPDIPAALAALNIRPEVAYAARSPLLHSHRSAPDVAYHFFANGSASETVDHEVAIVAPWAKATPYALDAWTGAVAPIAVHRRDGDRITLRITLAPGATTLVALARGAGPVHAVSTGAESVRRTDQGVLEVVDTRPGARETVLSDGRTVVTHIGALPAPLTLDRWSLRVADWRPGRTPDRHVTVDHRLSLDALAAWPDIPGLEDVSGVGRYRATVRLGRGWTGAGTGARLELGEVFDTCRVTVNGTAVGPVDQVTGVVDVGDLLRRGENTLEVEVATTLLNRLRTVRPAEFGAAQRQRYGLIGPVRLVPYGRAVVSGG
ncbi:glycosyl hydrolase [Streptomyces sp. NPDC044780]|uniref:glycosyl hydrolase n=1 Tax=unclassified Streptomyces TaxID=2593676 RepID=UPI0034020F69